MRKAFKMAMIGVASLAAVACSNGVNDAGHDNSNGVSFSVQPTTGLCFLTHGQTNQNAYAITHVPCTKEVLEQVPQAQRPLARVVVDTKLVSELK